MLSKIDIEEILEYRRKSKDTYTRWEEEINRFAISINDCDINNIENEIKKMVIVDLKPKIKEYHDEMISIRNEMFCEALKSIAKWEVPTISLAYFTELGLTGALSIFASQFVPPLIDYYRKKKDIERTYGVSYLIKISPI